MLFFIQPDTIEKAGYPAEHEDSDTASSRCEEKFSLKIHEKDLKSKQEKLEEEHVSLIFKAFKISFLS